MERLKTLLEHWAPIATLAAVLVQWGYMAGRVSALERTQYQILQRLMCPPGVDGGASGVYPGHTNADGRPADHIPAVCGRPGQAHSVILGLGVCGSDEERHQSGGRIGVPGGCPVPVGNRRRVPGGQSAGDSSIPRPPAAPPGEESAVRDGRKQPRTAVASLERQLTHNFSMAIAKRALDRLSDLRVWWAPDQGPTPGSGTRCGATEPAPASPPPGVQVRECTECMKAASECVAHWRNRRSGTGLGTSDRQHKAYRKPGSNASGNAGIHAGFLRCRTSGPFRPAPWPAPAGFRGWPFFPEEV